MPQKKTTVSSHAIQAPSIDRTSLEEITGDTILVDQAVYRSVQMADCLIVDQKADDLLFEQVVCKQTNFSQTNLTIAQLIDVHFHTCDFAAIDFEKPYIRRVELTDCRLLGASLAHADIQDMVVQKCHSDMLRLSECRLRSVRFDRCSLRKSSFENSDLSGVIFRDCDLTQADLRGTKLKGTDFRGSTLEGVQVGMKELHGAIIDPAQLLQLARLFGVVVRDRSEL